MRDTHCFPNRMTPPVEPEASRESVPGCSRAFSTFHACPAKTLILAHTIRPEWVAMLAGLAFRGQANG